MIGTQHANQSASQDCRCATNQRLKHRRGPPAGYYGIHTHADGEKTTLEGDGYEKLIG